MSTRFVALRDLEDIVADLSIWSESEGGGILPLEATAM